MSENIRLNSFIKERPYLVWYVSDYATLNAEAIVEAVLNYGDWNDVQELIDVLGIETVAKIFREKSRPSKIGRQNYLPEVKHYFTLYFEKYA